MAEDHYLDLLNFITCRCSRRAHLGKCVHAEMMQRSHFSNKKARYPKGLDVGYNLPRSGLT